MSLELKIAICDNEEYDRIQIKNLITRYLIKKDVLFHIDMFEDGRDFCKEERNMWQYDIIFLDIKMKGMNGIDTAYAIRKRNREMDIVFVTLISKYVFEGYKVNAMRYIMKPELEQLLPECMNALLKKRQYSGPKMEFPFIGGKRNISLSEILYIESKSHKLCFERTGKTLYMYGQINELEPVLSDYDFVRCHQSYLVNLEHVDKINNYWIHLFSGVEIPVSRPKYSVVKQRYLQYQR